MAYVIAVITEYASWRAHHRTQKGQFDKLLYRKRNEVERLLR